MNGIASYILDKHDNVEICKAVLQKHYEKLYNKPVMVDEVPSTEPFHEKLLKVTW